jgi:hypothetical protein
MPVLSYGGFNALENTTWNLDSGSFYGTATIPQFSESILFGTETLYTGYKEIQCTLNISTQILYGVLRVDDLGGGNLNIKFIVGDAEKITGNFDLDTGILLIYTKDINIFMKYVP